MDGSAEVAQFHGSILGHEEIRRLDIQMDETFLVDVRNGPSHVSEYAPDFLLGKQDTAREASVQLLGGIRMIIVILAVFTIAQNAMVGHV